MSAAEKISVRVGDITIKATQRTTAKALLAHALDQAGAVSIARHAANTATPPALGELWPEQGGIYAGLMRGEDGRPDYHLVAAADEAGQLKGAWGCSGIEIKGAASRNDGLANTAAMAEAGSDLAKKMLALEIDGHADWYLPSQFFANVLLNPLDQFVKHRLRCRHYARYVDDFVLLHEDPCQLTAWEREIIEWLPANLGLQVNPKKTIRQPVDRGVDFVGQVILPHRRIVRRRTLRNAIQRIKTGSPDSLFETINSYYGLLAQASHSHNDRVRLSHAVLARGHVVNGDLTKTYRREA